MNSKRYCIQTNFCLLPMLLTFPSYQSVFSVDDQSSHMIDMLAMIHGGLGIGLIVDIHSLFPSDIPIITNSPLPPSQGKKENGGHPCVSADVSSSSRLVPLNKMLSNDGIDNFLYAAPL